MAKSAKSKISMERLFNEAGITINGPNPWDITVHNEEFYHRVLRQGSLGLGESYMDGWWDSKQLDETTARILQARLREKISINAILIFNYIRAHFFNRHRAYAFNIGEKHYDAGNDLYRAMLDKRLTYTCGYWKNASTLDEAQEAKLELICKKINLQKGQRVLDVGSGWGSFITYAAERYGAQCVGITVSKEQADYANAHRNGLPIETRLQDYQSLHETFDHIVSVGMFEHVGHKNYMAFMCKIHNLLSGDGFFLLHTIGSNKTVPISDPWFDKYIFPDGILPSIKQIGEAMESKFVMEDWHNFGADYDKTLMAWYANINTKWGELGDIYDNRFHRMWEYYLRSLAGSFRSRTTQLWQIVLSKNGVPGGYHSIR
jgi:cyclopropane-fatty-acyl-phospholipid synthase